MKKEELFHMIGEVDEQKVAVAGMAMSAKKKSRAVWLKWGAMAACLCLVVVSVFIARDLQDEYGGAGSQPGGTSGTNILEPDNNPEKAVPAKTNLLVVNEVDSLAIADMDVEYSSFNKLPEDAWTSVLEEFEKFAGIRYEDFTKKIPNTWECSDFYALSTRDYKDADRKDEYRLHDYVFDYHTENGGRATIALCSFEAPLRDEFISCDNPEKSEINGVSVVIYGTQDYFMVQFSYENVNYDIETNNITLEELETLLTGIMS